MSKTNEMIIPIGRVKPQLRFYWCGQRGYFGGRVLEHGWFKTLIEDSGCDGNTYSRRKVWRWKKVRIEVRGYKRMIEYNTLTGENAQEFLESIDAEDLKTYVLQFLSDKDADEFFHGGHTHELANYIYEDMQRGAE